MGAAENNSKDLKGFYKNQGAHEKKAEQHVAATANKWSGFSKERQEKRNAAETNALLKETYENSINKSIVNAMIVKENDDERFRDIINIETQKISGKVKNKKNGSEYKMSTRPATKSPTKENIAQSR